MATTTQTMMAPDWWQSYAQSAAQRGANLAGAPYQAYGAPRVVGWSPEQEAGARMMATRATAGSPVTQQAGQYLQGVMSGQYLTGDPNLERQITANQDQVASRINSQFRGPNWGGSAQQQILAEQLGNVGAQMRGQNYQAERGRQMQAMLFAPQMAAADYADASALFDVGQKRQGLNQQVADANYQEFLRSQEWPFKTQQAYLQSLGLSPGSTTSTVAPDPERNRMAGALGGAMLGYGAGTLGAGALSNYFGVSSDVAPWLGAGAGGVLGAFL